VVKRRAIFFDRDGVLVVPHVHGGRTFAVTTLEDFQLYPETREALQLSSEAGFFNVVVTNQPDVASGKVPKSVVEAMHLELLRLAAVDRIEVSYDASGSNARRRKPNPGMLLDAAEAEDLDLAASFVIGDRAVDMEAARSAGCIAVFIDRGYVRDPRPQDYDHSTENVLDAVLWCIGHGSASRND